MKLLSVAALIAALFALIGGMLDREGVIKVLAAVAAVTLIEPLTGAIVDAVWDVLVAITD